MEAWREEFYRRNLVHHGIKGQQWGVTNGPPYPLDPDAHSAAEKKHITKGMIKDFIKKYGTKEDLETWKKKINGEDKEEKEKKKKGSSGRSGSGKGSGKKEEKKEEKKKEDELEAWEGPLYKYLERVKARYEWTTKELVKNIINSHGKDQKGKKHDEFLVALSDSKALKSDEWKELQKNSKELERMRKKALDYYKKIQEEEEETEKLRGKNNPKEIEKRIKEQKQKAAEEKEKEKIRKQKEREKAQKEREAAKRQKEREAAKRQKERTSTNKRNLSHSEVEIFIDDYLMHVGVGPDDDPPGRGSGRYPKGSGERPYQHDPSMAKKRTFKDKVTTFVNGSPTVQAHRMSNDQLRSAIERFKLQQEYINRSSDDVTDGRNFVEAMLIRYGTKTVTKFVDDMANKTGAKAANDFFKKFVSEGAPKKKKEKEESKPEKKEEPKPEKKEESKPEKKEEPKPEKKEAKSDSSKSSDKKWTKEENKQANEELQDLIEKRSKEMVDHEPTHHIPSREEAGKMVNKILGDWADDYTKTEKEKMINDIIEEAKKYAGD